MSNARDELTEELLNSVRAAATEDLSPDGTIRRNEDLEALFDTVMNRVRAQAWDEAIDAAAQQGTIQIPDNPYRITSL